MPVTSKAAVAASLLSLATPSVSLAAPLNFLGAVPSRLPSNCSGRQEDQDAYLELVRTADRHLEEEARRRDEKIKAGNKANQPKMEAAAAARSGISPEQLARLKQLEQERRTASPEQRKVLDAEKARIASQIMEARMGISKAEMTKVKGQSKEAQARWARSASADVQAAQAADPAARPPGTMSTGDTRAFLSASAQVKDLSRKVQAAPEKAAQRIGELDADPVGLRMLHELGDKRERIGELMGAGSSPEMDRLAREIEALESGYCARFGPKLLTILRDYRAELEASLADYPRLDQALAELYTAQAGVESPAEPGGTELAAVRGYVGVLSKVFKYDVRREKR
jgi:hypothetical protein